MNVDALDQALEQEHVVIGTGTTVNQDQKYHQPAFDGALTSNCGGFQGDGHRMERRHAQTAGIQPCQYCYPHGGHQR